MGDAHEHTPLPSPDVPKHPEGSASQATKGFYLFFTFPFQVWNDNCYYWW